MILRWLTGVFGTALFVVALGLADARQAAADIESVSQTNRSSYPATGAKYPETVLQTRPERLAFNIGHNASPTTYVTKADTWTIGNYALGYAISDSLLIATSPWIWTSYNTMNLTAKYIVPISSRARAGIFSAYFQSYQSKPFLRCESDWACRDDGTFRRLQVSDENGFPVRTISNFPWHARVDRYQFQTLTTHALFGLDLTHTTIHAGLKYSYFFNDDNPYSLRMDPGVDAIRGQIDVTALFENRLSERLRLNLEAGTLGLNFLQPYLHVGASIAIVFPRVLVQLGGSLSGRFADFGTSAFFTPAFDQRVHTSRDGQLYFSRYLTSAIHPELQVQYFF